MEKRSRMTRAPTTRQQPIVAMREVGDSLLVRIELPGVKSTDVDVRISDDALIIRQGKPVIRRQDNQAGHGETPGIVGSSLRLQACLTLARQATANDGGVLIAGEAGTGKELFARFIHEHSRRAGGRFVVVDCTAMPPELMTSLLFGSGAESGTGLGAGARQGLIGQAHQGTLFLDEVSDLPPVLQNIFLPILHRHPFRQTGSAGAEASDFRLIASTRHKPAREADNGLCVIDLPPLRERIEDLGALTRHFINKFCCHYNLPGKQMTPEFLLNITHYAWPGNVHELSNVLEQAIFNAQAESTLFPKHLPVNVRVQATKALWQARHAGAAVMTPSRRGNLPKLQDMRESVFSRAEQQYLHNLINLTGRDMEQACELSGLSRSRLYTLLKKHQIATH